MTARNAPCPCGSGKKYRQCHGAAASPPANPLREAQQALDAGSVEECLRLAEATAPSPERQRLLTAALIRRREAGDLDRARMAISAWARLDERSVEPWQRLAEIHFFAARLEEAETACLEMSRRAPGLALVHYYMGILRQLQGELEEAAQCYAQALLRQGRFSADDTPLARSALSAAAAMQMCETAAGHYPGSPAVEQEGMFGKLPELAALEQRLTEWEGISVESAATVPQQQRSSFSTGWYNLGCAALAAFTADDRRVELFQKAVDLDPGNALARLNRVFSLNYSTRASREEIFAAHTDTGRWLEQTCGPACSTFENSRDATRRLRIGYLSSDFRRHSVAHFILPVLAAHDRDRFEVYVYHNHQRTDDYTERSRRLAGTFRQVDTLSDRSLQEAIRADRIDILIDLNGLSGNHRMRMLAMRAAPVQVNWIGYPNTTGLRTVDYRIVDAITDPVDGARDFATEKLLRMPRVFSVYQSPEELPPLAPAPFTTAGHITFGSFNSMPKLNEPLLACWARVLAQTSGSRLLLKNSALGYPAPRAQVLEVFAANGIGAERVELCGQTASVREHLEHYRRVDICLDSYPYNGTTTTCDSLAMGVPVISRSGDDHRSRVGASQLAALGLDSLVCNDENTCVETAAGLAGDPERLLALRSGLRERLHASPLMDATTFTRELESSLVQAWMDYCHKDPA